VAGAPCVNTRLLQAAAERPRTSKQRPFATTPNKPAPPSQSFLEKGRRKRMRRRRKGRSTGKENNRRRWRRRKRR
jgi:hypothetical protein